MKKSITLSILGWFFACILANNCFAQNGNTDKEETITNIKPLPKDKETQEIIIRKKGSKDTKVTLEITGSKVLINGKPMAEFKEDGITINNRKIIIKDGNKITMDFNGDFVDDLDKIEGLNEITVDKFRSDNIFGDGEISKPFLGVVTEKCNDGAKIISVESNSPAEKAGLQKDDIIYKINDKPVLSSSTLADIITGMKKDENVTVYFLRDGNKKEAKATLSEHKNRFGINRMYSYKMPSGKVRSLTIPRTFKLPNIDRLDGTFNFGDKNWNGDDGILIDVRRQKLGIKIQDTEEGNGVKILSIDEESAGTKAGLLKDDIITEIDGKKINNTDDAREQLRTTVAKTNYSIKLNRAGKEINLIVKIPKKLKTAQL